MSTLRVSLLGKFVARSEDEVVVGLEARKLQELFAYLLLHRDRSHSREYLVDLLWSDSPPAQARKNLRQTLWQLQCLLEPHSAPDGARLISGNADWVMLKSHPNLWLDVALFEQAVSRASGIHGADFDGELAEQVRQAVAVYGGDLLDSYYQDWCLYERERLQNGYLALLEKLMSYCEARRDYEAAIEYGSRILRCDRAREQTHMRLMELYYSAGDRVAALRQYQRCVDVLREDLGIGPARPTVELYRQIRADGADDALPPADHSSLSDALGRLKVLWRNFKDLQQELQDNIAIIERLVRDR